ncbi:MAG: response regulator [Acidobacteriota bacterium]|nr:response regulator [Acidobacteriota bacterium]MDE2965437.1 response regulator [Acidobacteriota bacterium]
MDRKHILVVDDDPHILELIRTILTQGNYRVTTAGDGQRALDSLRGSRVDAVITDALMPGLDGPALTEKIKADPNLKDLPVIMITASSQPGMVRKSFSSGCMLFLPKPFTRASLISILQLALGQESGPKGESG